MFSLNLPQSPMDLGLLGPNCHQYPVVRYYYAPSTLHCLRSPNRTNGSIQKTQQQQLQSWTAKKGLKFYAERQINLWIVIWRRKYCCRALKLSMWSWVWRWSGGSSGHLITCANVRRSRGKSGNCVSSSQLPVGVVSPTREAPTPCCACVSSTSSDCNKWIWRNHDWQRSCEAYITNHYDERTGVMWRARFSSQVGTSYVLISSHSMATRRYFRLALLDSSINKFHNWDFGRHVEIPGEY